MFKQDDWVLYTKEGEQHQSEGRVMCEDGEGNVFLVEFPDMFKTKYKAENLKLNPRKPFWMIAFNDTDCMFKVYLNLAYYRDEWTYVIDKNEWNLKNRRGNCFETEEEAQEVCDRFNEILKNRLDKS